MPLVRGLNYVMNIILDIRVMPIVMLQRVNICLWPFLLTYLRIRALL